MSDPLTVAEAVSLGTVSLQRLLDRANVRSLTIKGPAFVALRVRRDRDSHDIDLLIHPQDRDRAARALISANWTSISHRLPRALDDFAYSTTYRHSRFPVSVDVHHAYLGLLDWPAAFDEIWRRRTVLQIAHRNVAAPSREDALLLELLNEMKARRPCQWEEVVARVIKGADCVDVRPLERAAESVGARETASLLIDRLGGSPTAGLGTPAYNRWARECGADRRKLLFYRLVRRAPWALPGFLWQQVRFGKERGKFWADAHGVRFRNGVQIFVLRTKEMVRPSNKI